MFYISLVISFLYFFLLIYYILGWNKIPVFSPDKKPVKTPVSVIVAARNEAKNIVACIEGILNQNFPKDLFEIILVDDESEDKTLEIAQGIKDKRLKIFTRKPNDNYPKYKKGAIQFGIDNAKFDLIVCTDADCFFSNNWLKTLVKFYEQNNYKFISGPVVLQPTKTFFERFQALEFMGLNAIGAASIAQNNPSMCNGANLLYEKSVFYKVKGFQGNEKIASGDDEFLMHKIAQKHSVGFLKSAQTIVKTVPQANWKHFYNQRKRWASKSKFYQNKSITATMALVFLFNLSILVNLFFACFLSLSWFCLLGFQVFFKIIFEGFLLWKAAGFYKNRNLLLVFPFAQIIQIPYVIAVALFSNLGNYTWKNRVVK